MKMAIVPHILVCPLNWGLGHASRMIPVIYELLGLGCKVTVVASHGPLQLLREEFSSRVDYYEFAGANIRYPKNHGFFFKLALQIPALFFSIIRERRFANRTVQTLNPQMILSDNRYGMKSSKIFSVFVTHQLHIQLPNSIGWFEKPLNAINHYFVKSFDRCLVPDFEKEPSLSGALSHHVDISHLIYTGPLSRFQMLKSKAIKKPNADLPNDFILVILSGPEPQRSILENLLQIQLQGTASIWFRGMPGGTTERHSANQWIFDHGNTEMMAWCIENSRLVICRSGYSSVMDLAVYGKKCVFIPTPGQTEQEYLARYLQNAGYIARLEQSKIKGLKGAIEEATQKSGLPQYSGSNHLRALLKQLLDECTPKEQIRQ
jgi:uncharacterized protein (TIGR00661 family)